MVENFPNGVWLGDESKDFHLAAALVTGQGVDLVDTVDEPLHLTKSGGEGCPNKRAKSLPQAHG